MVDQCSTSQAPVASIFLDYGADVFECDEDSFEVCDRGMLFQSRWQFAVGSELAVVLSIPRQNGPPERVNLQALVASCEPISARCHRVLALFIDLPEKLRTQMQQIGCELRLRSEAGLAGRA